MPHWIVRHISYTDKDRPCGHHDNAEDALEHFNIQYVEETGGVLTTKENTAPCFEYFLREQREESSGFRDVGKSVRLFWGL